MKYPFTGWWSEHYWMLCVHAGTQKPDDAPDYVFVAKVYASSLEEARSQILKIQQYKGK